MSDIPKVQQTFSGAQIGSVFGGDNKGIIHVNLPEQKQTLAEAAHEIQRLLKQLEENNPEATLEQKTAWVNAGVDPTLKKRAVNALKSGGKAALNEFLDNPYVNITMAIVEGWNEG